jgi:NADPH2:quinone reductase
VIATTGSLTKQSTLRALGADEVLHYPTADLSADVKRITGGQGAGIALDGGGQATFPACLDAIGMHGRVVIYGTMTGVNSELAIRKMLSYQGSVSGIALWTNRYYEASLKSVQSLILPAVANGAIKAPIDKIVPLDGVPDALQLLAERKVKGKLVVAT